MKDEKNTDKNYVERLTKKFYEEFPEYENKVFILDPDKHTSVESYMRDNLAFAELFFSYKSKNDQIKTKNAINCTLKMNLPSAHFIKKLFGPFISLVLPLPFIHQLEKIAPKEIVKPLKEEPNIFIETIFHHEIGHTIYNNMYALPSRFFSTDSKRKQYRLQSETFAESYAFIRMQQSVGLEHPAMNAVMQYRTLTRQRKAFDEHNFLPAIQEVIKHAKTGTLDHLSAHESAGFALETTKKHTIKVKDSMRIGKELSPVYNNFTKNNSDLAIKNMLKVARNTSNMAVLNDLQYTAQFIEDVPFYPNEFKQQISKVWSELSKNKTVQKHGYTKQHWRANNPKL